MNPAEEGKLLAKILLLQVGNKANKADDVKHERNEPVVLGKRKEVGVDKHNVLEIVDDRLAVQKVVCDHEKVPNVSEARSYDLPVESLAPSIARLGVVATTARKLK